jgi:hypothetical protein
MSEEEQSAAVAERLSPEQKKFQVLVTALSAHGQFIYNEDGSKSSKEAEYFLPDGRILIARQILDQDYDKGTEVVFKDAALNRNGKPYEVHHYYSVYDQGKTSQNIHATDERPKKQQGLLRVTGMPPQSDDDARQQEWHVLPEEPREFESLVRGHGSNEVADEELADLIKEIMDFRNSGRLELLPPKDYPKPKSEEDQTHAEAYAPILGAISTKESHAYRAAQEALRPASLETKKDYEELAKEMVEGGEIVSEEFEYNDKAKPSYKRAFYELVDGREAEIRVDLDVPYKSYPTRAIVYLRRQGTKPDGEEYVIIDEYYLEDDYSLRHYLLSEDQLTRDVDEFNDSPLPEDANDEERQERGEREKELGQDIASHDQYGKNDDTLTEAGIHRVSESELKNLLRQLKVAERINQPH